MTLDRCMLIKVPAIKTWLFASHTEPRRLPCQAERLRSGALSRDEPERREALMWLPLPISTRFFFQPDTQHPIAALWAL